MNINKRQANLKSCLPSHENRFLKLLWQSFNLIWITIENTRKIYWIVFGNSQWSFSHWQKLVKFYFIDTGKSSLAKIEKMTKFRIKLSFNFILSRFLEFIKIISSEKRYLSNNVWRQGLFCFIFIPVTPVLCPVPRAEDPFQYCWRKAGGLLLSH